MRKIVLLLVFLLSFGCVWGAGLDQNTDTENDNIYLYSTWDSDYFYIGCEVQCPNVQGKNVQFNGPIGDDDGLEIVADLSYSHSKKITPSCFSFSASAAGGFEFKKGTDKGVLVAENIYSHKITTNVIGTINNPSDIDTGFVIELAIPWDMVTDSVPENKIISFSYKVRAAGKDYYLTDEKEFYNPSTWYDMMMTTYTSTFVTKVQNRIMCGTYLSNAPTIDGVIKKGEWNNKTKSNIKIPIDKNLYKLSFKSQKFIAKELVIGEGKSFIDNPKRVDVVKKAILDLSPVDVIYVPVNENLPHILEAVRAIDGEKNIIIPIIPIINAKDNDEFVQKLNEFIFVVPNQYRLVTSDEKADRIMYVKSNSENLDLDKINENYKLSQSVADEFKVSLSDNYVINDRIVSEYAYVISNYTAPKKLSLKEPDQFNFVIKNVGSVIWKPLDMSISYRWYKNDRFYTQGFIPIPITKEVAPGETLNLNTSLLPVNYENKPLETGDVVVEIQPIRSDNERLITSQSLMLKTTISDEEIDEGIKVVSVDMTKKQELNKPYDIILDIQNSSLKNMTKDECLYATLAQVDEAGNIIKEYDKERSVLYCVDDIPVGMIGKLTGKLKFSQGKKEEAKDIETGKFAVVISEKKGKEYIPIYRESVEFVEGDFNQKLLLASEFPEKIVKNSKIEFKVIVRNAGKVTWKSDAKLIANWYDQNGKMTDNGGFTRISKKKIKPGDISMVDVFSLTPSRPGKYNLVIGIYANEKFLSSVDADRANNLIVIPVNVLSE